MRPTDCTRVQNEVGTAATQTHAERTHAEQTWTAVSEAFHVQTCPYIEAVYADALCLTGNGEEAADLVTEAYVRAFQEYKREYQKDDLQTGGEGVPPRRWTQDTLAWLYRNLHAVFCEGILSRVARDASPTGDQI